MSPGNVYFCLHIHSNFWYAEYTHEQAIRQFVKLYEGILDVFERHNGGAACWDLESQITLDMLRETAPEIIRRIDILTAKGAHEVVPCTWGTPLATHLTRAEFDDNFQETFKQMRATFQHVASTWMSQDGGFSPQFVPIMKKEGMKYLLLDHRILNRHYAGKYPLEARFRPNIIAGQGETLPCLFFGIEGLNSYGDFAEAFKKQLEKLKDLRQKHPDMNFLIYPFIDAERINPPKLDKWLSEIEATGAKYCTPGQFLKLEPNTGTQFEFDVGDWHDWSFHNDILADQRLFTLVERARDKLEEASWWKSQIDAFHIPVSEAMQAKYDQMLAEASREIQICQGSDKSHWYASAHKMEIGQQYATSAFERASYVVGIYSSLLTRAKTFLPDRPQAMKDPSLNLTLLNPYETIGAYPAKFPLGFEFPYIVTVNLNTSPCYEIQDYPQKNIRIPTPTIFNIIPGLSVHNLRTELFFQLPEPLSPGKCLPLKIVPQDDEAEFDEIEGDTLENELIVMKFGPSGDILQITDKKSGTVFENKMDKERPLLHAKFDCQLARIGSPKNAELEVLNRDSDMANSVVFERQSREQDGGHRLKLTTKYRLFPGFSGFMIDSIAAIAGPLPGYYCPFELDWPAATPEASAITRDVIGELVTTPHLLSHMHQIFLNDWCLLQSGDAALGFAFEKKIMACKQLLYTPASAKNPVSRLSLGFMRHFPEWVAQNLLAGVVHQRLWLVPLTKSSDKSTSTSLLRMLSKPPVVGWYL